MTRKTFWSLWVHQRGDKRYHSAPLGSQLSSPMRSGMGFGLAEFSIDEKVPHEQLTQLPEMQF